MIILTEDLSAIKYDTERLRVMVDFQKLEWEVCPVIWRSNSWNRKSEKLHIIEYCNKNDSYAGFIIEISNTNRSEG